MTVTQTTHSISIQVKCVLEDASCEASEASVGSDCFCLQGTGEGSEATWDDECEEECSHSQHYSKHYSQHYSPFHRLGPWHCPVRLGMGAWWCLSLFAFMMSILENKASSNRQLQYLHPTKAPRATTNHHPYSNQTMTWKFGAKLSHNPHHIKHQR